MSSPGRRGCSYLIISSKRGYKRSFIHWKQTSVLRWFSVARADERCSDLCRDGSPVSPGTICWHEAWGGRLPMNSNVPTSAPVGVPIHSTSPLKRAYPQRRTSTNLKPAREAATPHSYRGASGLAARAAAWRGGQAGAPRGACLAAAPVAALATAAGATKDPSRRLWAQGTNQREQVGRVATSGGLGSSRSKHGDEARLEDASQASRRCAE